MNGSIRYSSIICVRKRNDDGSDLEGEDCQEPKRVYYEEVIVTKTMAVNLDGLQVATLGSVVWDKGTIEFLQLCL